TPWSPMCWNTARPTRRSTPSLSLQASKPASQLQTLPPPTPQAPSPHPSNFMDNPMDNPEPLATQASQPADLNLLQAQVEALGSMVMSVLILLIVLAATFDLFLMRQIKDTRADLPNL